MKEMGTRLQRQTGQEVELANLSRGRKYLHLRTCFSEVIQQVSSIEYIIQQFIRMDSITTESSSVNNGALVPYTS